MSESVVKRTVDPVRKVFKHIKSRPAVSRALVVCGLLLFAGIGVAMLHGGSAATSTTDLEAESGTLSGNAKIAADGNASGGKAVSFNSSGGSSGSGGTSAGNGKFYVVGKDIVDPDGKLFYPVGANVAIKLFDYNYVFEGGNGGANQHVQEIKDWHWNIVRANLICDNDSGTPSLDQLVSGLQTEVPKITAQKIVVMLECHDQTGVNPQVGSAKDLKVRAFWDRMATMFKDNPYVWFNIYNEPWNGAPDSSYTSLQTYYIDRMRAAGAQNVIVVDAPVYGQGLEYLAEQSTGTTIANGKCNVVFSWHAYGAFKNQQGSTDQFETAIKQVQAKNLALMVGEMGVAYPPESGNAGPYAWNISGFNSVLSLGPKYGVGMLWWHATGDSSTSTTYALKTNRGGYWSGGAGAGLTEYGQSYWNASQAAASNLGTFTGKLSDSHCSGT